MYPPSSRCKCHSYNFNGNNFLMYWHSRTTPKTFPLQVYSYVLYNFQIPCNLWVEEILCVQVLWFGNDERGQILVEKIRSASPYLTKGFSNFKEEIPMSLQSETWLVDWNQWWGNNKHDRNLPTAIQARLCGHT